MRVLNDWARLARGKTPEGEEPPWSARNFFPYWSQVVSTSAQKAAAAEILSRVREEVATRNAASMRGGRRVQSKPPPVGSDPQDPYSVKSTWAGAYRTCFSLTNRWVCYAQTYGAVMHRGSDHLKPVRFLSFYGFVMRRPALTSRTVSSTLQDSLRVKRAWVRCVTTYALTSERGFDASRPTRPLVRRGVRASRPTSC